MGQRCQPQSLGEEQRCNPMCLLLTAAQYCCCSWASPTDQLVRKFNDGLGINTTMKKKKKLVPVQTMKKIFLFLQQLYCSVLFGPLLPRGDTREKGTYRNTRDIDTKLHIIYQVYDTTYRNRSASCILQYLALNSTTWCLQQHLGFIQTAVPGTYSSTGYILRKPG